MNKPLSHIRNVRRGQRVLSASDLNAAFDFLKMLQRNFTAAAPLEVRSSASGIHLALAAAVLPAGAEGEVLFHDGAGWARLEAPAADSVLFFNADTGLPEWIGVTEDCPQTTTTTQAATTTLAPTTTTQAPTTTTTQAWNPGEDKCCRESTEVNYVCSSACTDTLIRSCSSGVYGSCPTKTGNCHYDRTTDPLHDCSPDCRYIHSHNDCDPYESI